MNFDTNCPDLGGDPSSVLITGLSSPGKCVVSARKIMSVYLLTVVCNDFFDSGNENNLRIGPLPLSAQEHLIS
jgi:hypothetical protein